MATIPRVVYFAQTGVLTTPYDTYTLPVLSANIETSRPIESMSSFGKFSSLNTAQTNLTTCKATLKCHLGNGSGINPVDAYFLNDLISNTQSSSGFSLKVSPNGFSMTGILTNIGLDISVGGLGMCDLSFAGIGNPNISAPISTATDSNTLMNITPVTMNSVVLTGSLTGVYATSLKLSYDMPTDTLSRLGDNPNATQGNLVSTIATKPPYKATINTDGYGVDPTQADSFYKSQFNIGEISFYLPNAKVNARSFNNAAGQVSSKFNYTIEDSSCIFLSNTFSYKGFYIDTVINGGNNANIFTYWNPFQSRSVLNSSTCTFSGWFYLHPSMDGKLINLFSIDQGSSFTGQNAIFIAKNANNGLTVITYGNSDIKQNIWLNSTGFTSGQWFHLMVTVNNSSSTINVYKNGVLLTPDSLTFQNTTAIPFAYTSMIFEMAIDTSNTIGTTSNSIFAYAEIFFKINYFATDTSPFRSSDNHPIDLGSVLNLAQIYIRNGKANSADSRNVPISSFGIVPSPYGIP